MEVAAATEAEAKRHGHLWRNVLRLASGVAVSHAIVLVTTPILTRFYSPHDFGVSAFFLSVVLILSPLGSLNYYQAVVLPRNDTDAVSLARLSLSLSFVTSIVSLGVFYGLRGLCGAAFDAPELVSWFWVFPAAVFARSAYLVLASWMSRQRNFGIQANARVAQALTERGLSLAAGFGGMASATMMVGTRVVSIVVETAILLVPFLRAHSRGWREPEAKKHLKRVAREYQEFPKYSTWAMLLANGNAQLPLLVLPLLFSPEIAGLFALGNRLLQIPMQLLGDSIRNVYYKELAERIAARRETRFGFTELRRHLVKAGVFPFMILLLFGRVIFATLFGPEWARAGEFCGIVGFYIFFQFIGTPLSCVFNAYRRQRYMLLISLLLFMSSGGSLLVGRWCGSAEVGLLLMSVTGVAIYVLMNFLAERLVGAMHHEQFVTYGSALLVSVPFMAALYGVLRLVRAPGMMAASCLGLAACYYALIYRKRLGELYALWSARRRCS